MGNILTNLSDYIILRRFYNLLRNNSTYPNLDIPPLCYENNQSANNEEKLDEENVSQSGNIDDSNEIIKRAVKARRSKCRKSMAMSPKENWTVTSTIIHRNKGFEKFNKSRKSMTSVLKDISNAKGKLRKVPRSPGGRPIRLRPIPDNSNELAAILKRRYANMHSPESHLFKT